jgi:hypothetical protein
MPDPKTPEALSEILKKYEDAESAILVYKEAGAITKAFVEPYETVRKTAKAMAEADLRTSGERKRITSTGNCGWTKPTKPVLDAAAWKEAQRKHPKLSTIQRAFDNAEADLDLAQEPFKVLPSGNFYIK